MAVITSSATSVPLAILLDVTCAFASIRSARGPVTMRFGSTAKVLLKCKLKYYRISECPVHVHKFQRPTCDQERDGFVPKPSLGAEAKIIINLMLEEASTLKPLTPGMTATCVQMLGVSHEMAEAQTVGCSGC